MKEQNNDNIGKILDFKNINEHKTTVLSEQDINNLFFGFVKLIKRSVIVQKENEYKTKILNLENELNKCKDKLNSTNKQKSNIISNKTKTKQ